MKNHENRSNQNAWTKLEILKDSLGYQEIAVHVLRYFDIDQRTEFLDDLANDYDIDFDDYEDMFE